ncbi:hypothetical protein VOLCADRAFT_91647 [Volvox carteri f. nagariensis]|uniref:Uncharacterized protein n=1 Tax=Volvox carteri f. nagariensis TaxID=3068 RepID=D8TXM4_VOLCA|nr:uncharacterized protein VOLCADRAFT_91647 [Volvox carteri f. nagariensis]EFJ47665.1 hypothetical protein VOLCADRAFT_91647 [Volvox carteri f. nagariensis]|eukprot:XP_002951136.1 hypothetical protein VOLCADRAFT_91647 [Volvox carteri f. nagariensis]
MAPKMARQSQVTPQTLAPLNLSAYGTPSTSQPSTSSTGAEAKPPVDIADLWAQLAAVSPTGGGRDRSSPAGVPKRPLTFKQQLLLGSMGCHDEDILRARHTNAQFNVLTALWITAAGSLRAETAIELIYDYGMDAATVLNADQGFARTVQEAAQKARASGAHLATTMPVKRPATSPAEPHASAPARTRFQPFRNHFNLTRLMSTANPALAHKMEAFYIAQFKARGPGIERCC